MAFLVLFLCVACVRYETPKLPAFTDDKISYEQFMQKRDELAKKIKLHRNKYPD